MTLECHYMTMAMTLDTVECGEMTHMTIMTLEIHSFLKLSTLRRLKLTFEALKPFRLRLRGLVRTVAKGQAIELDQAAGERLLQKAPASSVFFGLFTDHLCLSMPIEVEQFLAKVLASAALGERSTRLDTLFELHGPAIFDRAARTRVGDELLKEMLG